MDKDRIEGNVKQGWGKAEEAVGDATDNPGTGEEGRQDQAEGQMQEAWGKVKDAGRDMLDEDAD